MSLTPYARSLAPDRGIASYETPDGLYDVAWSEAHENQLASVSGDGSVKLWDVMLNVRPPHCSVSGCDSEQGKPP